MYIFGFIVAAVVGCTAGSVDLTEGMFRHLVITGRSRLALYFARIPAGLAIVIAMVAIGYTIVCAVCVFAAPTQLNYDGVNVPAGALASRPGHLGGVACRRGHLQLQLQRGPRAERPAAERALWQGQIERSPAGDGDPDAEAAERSPSPPVNRRPRFGRSRSRSPIRTTPTTAPTSLVPPTSLMVDVGLWIALEATIGFIVGLGLASLMGQRTVPVILLVVLELILTPIFSRHVISHLLNVERGIVGVAMVHIEPGDLPTPFSGGGPGGGGGGGLAADTGVDPGGVTGDRGLDRVLDRHRGLADGFPRRLSGPGPSATCVTTTHPKPSSVVGRRLIFRRLAVRVFLEPRGSAWTSGKGGTSCVVHHLQLELLSLPCSYRSLEPRTRRPGATSCSARRTKRVL